jgi:hypothetical protein
MAHYALINSDNIVVNVITGVDENIIQTDLDGTQVGGTSEAWETFYATRPWLNATYCKRTSYNGNIRKNYASIGDVYDSVRDAFISPKPFNSWILNEDTCRWQSPAPMPTEGRWYWDEENLMWQKLEN